ncbi:hypothetical protein NDU88_002406 [Pleurodeles waltl]|uniref:Uncharacterized protein n=1 Tax=Pleurodeles waltl TaxID=8319 RepID=A0AAV7W0K3_PLEWA|nr:hypothetical protein NDU88_002406 [Pleurodeles waltl]
MQHESGSSTDVKNGCADATERQWLDGKTCVFILSSQLGDLKESLSSRYPGGIKISVIQSVLGRGGVYTQETALDGGRGRSACSLARLDKQRCSGEGTAGGTAPEAQSETVWWKPCIRCPPQQILAECLTPVLLLDQALPLALF